MTTPLRPSNDRLTYWSRRTVGVLLTASLLLGSLSATATALGDPELVALLALVGCALAVFGLGLTEMRRRRFAARA